MGEKEEEKHENNVKQEQIHDLIFGKEIGWQEIIHDLINSEQLDPWNIDIIILTDKYLVKISELEEADFFMSSKVLLAAALLLRIKSEILLNKYIKSIDEILFGREDKKKYQLERIELDEEVPELIPRSPIPRFKKITLQELMESLDKAIITENRRIQKEITHKNALRESSISLPKRKFSIKDKIRDIYDKLFKHLDDEKKKVSFTEFIGDDKEERIICFSSLLHLENQKKVWMHQPEHFDEIEIWLRKVFFKHNPDIFEELRKELEREMIELDKPKRRFKKVSKDFENPLREMFEGLI